MAPCRFDSLARSAPTSSGRWATVGRPGMPRPSRSASIRGVAVEPERLEVRSLVPVESQPAQRRLDALGPLGAGALEVGVLDPEDERSVLVMAGVEPIEQGGAGAADVEEPGRGRREPDPDG